jgi:hypothetical protein
MNIFQSRKLTDAEFVEKVRKQLRRNRRWAWIGIVGSITFIVFFVWIFILFVDFVSSMGQLSEHVSPKSQMFYTGLTLGCTFGAVLTIILGKIIFYFCESLILLFGNRRDKLLVAYYDQIHPLDAKAPAPSNISKL